MLRIRRARALDGYRVRLTLTNGDVVERDLEALVWGPVFEPLRRDYGRFRAVSVEAGTLTWPGGVDFDPDVLIWAARRQRTHQRAHPAFSSSARRPPSARNPAARMPGARTLIWTLMDPVSSVSCVSSWY